MQRAQRVLLDLLDLLEPQAQQDPLDQLDPLAPQAQPEMMAQQQRCPWALSPQAHQVQRHK